MNTNSLYLELLGYGAATNYIVEITTSSSFNPPYRIQLEGSRGRTGQFLGLANMACSNQCIFPNLGTIIRIPLSAPHVGTLTRVRIFQTLGSSTGGGSLANVLPLTGLVVLDLANAHQYSFFDWTQDGFTPANGLALPYSNGQFVIVSLHFFRFTVEIIF